VKNFDELIIKMGETPSGQKISEVVDTEEFKRRLNAFRSFLKEELSDFSEEEILKNYKSLEEFKKMMEWSGHHYLMAVIEFIANRDKRCIIT
jgi:hypothetical protein